MTTPFETEPSANQPIKECDLVMKGGITSGIVYPKAVLALKDTYRFRNIGGTSAGAIAAVATAAAEYGRDARDAEGKDGFGRLDDLNAALMEKDFLRSLFQPSPKTEALMEVASAAMKASSGQSKVLRVLGKLTGVAGVLVRHAPWAMLLGVGAGIGVGAGLSTLNDGKAQGLRQGVFLGLFGLLGGAVGGIWVLFRKLFHDIPDNGFGICIGHDPEAGAKGKTGSKPVLIDWLTDQIEGIGAKNESAICKGGLRNGQTYRVPLTFLDLRYKPNPICLKMMTTNVSEELPYVLPFENHRFLFEEAKMREYFPENVVDHLVTKCHQSDRRTPPPGFYFLPSADDMPIVVTMRMSLSFPILLSAVPLWSLGAGAFKRIKEDPDAPFTKEDLNENWFSDGGLSSNFPIQFFDSWLPTRPTFGINLAAYPPEAFDAEGNLLSNKFGVAPTTKDSLGRATPRSAADPTAPVYLPRANEYPPKIVNELPGLMSFLGAIVSTMQNYRDNQQSQLPSYRERIVQVRLEKSEGGLNLDMPAETLQRIAAKGSEAGQKLLSDFQLEEHQWTRFLVVMGQLETELREMKARLAVVPPSDKARFDAQLLLKKQQTPGFPYGFRPSDNPQWSQQAHDWVSNVDKVLADIDTLMQSWPQPPDIGTEALFARKPPQPASNLRLMPQLYEPIVDGNKGEAH